MLLTSAYCDMLVFCGHYPAFVTPAASYQIVKQSDQIRVDTHTFGYRILEIDGSEVTGIVEGGSISWQMGRKRGLGL